MKKVLLLLLMTIFIASCSNVEKTPALKEGDAAWETGQVVAAKMPFFDPVKNNVLVKSNNFVITSTDVVNAIHATMAGDMDRFETLSTAEIRKVLKDVTESLTERKLFNMAAAEEGIKIDPAQMDSVLKVYYSTAGSEERYASQLEAQGTTLNAFKADVEGLLKRQSYIQTFTNDIPASTDEEIEAAYNAIKNNQTATVRHILILTQNKSISQKQEALRKIRGLLRRARAGEDFAELAKKYTEDPGSKDNGGLYEDVKKGVMVKPFEDAAFSVPVGQISDVVQTEYGYHILKILNRTAELAPIEDVRVQIGQQIMMNKQNERYHKRVIELKLKNKVTNIAF